MKAAVVERKSSSEEGIRINDVAFPIIQNGNQLLVKVNVCGLSDTDVLVRSGVFEDIIQYPLTPGYQIVGTVISVGDQVKDFAKNDVIAAVISVDAQYGGCAEYCLINDYDAIRVPAALPIEEVSSALIPALRGMTALHYHLRIVAGDVIVIFDGASVNSFIAIQLAKRMGAKVYTTVTTTEQAKTLGSISSEIERIIDCGAENFVDVILEETAGLGVDALLGMPPLAALKRKEENARQLQGKEKDMDILYLQILDAVDALSVHGRWSAPFFDLQLNPPISRIMFMKNLNLSFLNEQSWVLSQSQHGRYHHVLREILNKLQHKQLKVPTIVEYTLQQIREAHNKIRADRSVSVVVRMPEESSPNADEDE